MDKALEPSMALLRTITHDGDEKTDAGLFLRNVPAMTVLWWRQERSVMLGLKHTQAVIGSALRTLCARLSVPRKADQSPA